MNFRRGTQDEGTIREVLTENCYLLPDKMEGDVVIDAGAHIGSFSLACLQRGCKQVLAVEPSPDNSRLFRENLKEFPNSKLYEAALGELKQTKANFFLGNQTCTACGSTITGKGKEVEAVPLSSLIGHARMSFRPDRIILKIDIEGAEYGALYTCPHLQELDVIMGESHQLTIEAFKLASDGKKWPMDHAGLLCYLTSLGFRVACRPMSPSHPGVNVAFWAWKPDCDFLGKDFHPEPMPGSVLA